MRAVPPLSILLLLSSIDSIYSQPTQTEPLKIGNITVSGSFRIRIESWDWFHGNANYEYAYPGSLFRVSFSETKKTSDWRLELAAPVLIDLPNDAIAPGVQGQLGLGASYFAANNKNTYAGLVFAKQGYIRFKGLGGNEGQTLKIGRMEFIDGAEVTPPNATLATVKRERIAHRLLGNSGFSEAGRSFDGVQYGLNNPKINLTLFSGRPDRGVYQVDGWGELKINVFYGALTGQLPGRRTAAEWRVFGLGYDDYRNNVLKTDNRTSAVRAADHEHINIGTFGGHFLEAFNTSAGPLDAMFWGVGQIGSWGNLKQRSYAFAVEGGWQPRVLQRLKPWLRAGYDYGSGDKNPSDHVHGTFFQVLPTPRTYARFPFFNFMNTRDALTELSLRPSKKVTVRSDFHSLRLAGRNDLWYSGGGAFQPWTFGYTGRPSSGNSGLANLYDVSADFNFNSHFTLGTYYGRANGKLIVASIYPNGKNANFGFLELLFNF